VTAENASSVKMAVVSRSRIDATETTTAAIEATRETAPLSAAQASFFVTMETASMATISATMTTIVETGVMKQTAGEMMMMMRMEMVCPIMKMKILIMMVCPMI